MHRNSQLIVVRHNMSRKVFMSSFVFNIEFHFYFTIHKCGIQWLEVAYWSTVISKAAMKINHYAKSFTYYKVSACSLPCGLNKILI